MRQKLHSNKGFTLSEVLVTMIILLLVTSVIAGGMPVVINAYENITLKAEAQILRATVLSDLMNELRYAENIATVTFAPEQTKSTKMITVTAFDSSSRGYRIYFKEDKAGEIKVYNFDNTAGLPLVTAKTQTDGLQARLTEYTYKDGVFNIKVEVYKGEDKKIVGQENAIIVRPINTDY